MKKLLTLYAIMHIACSASAQQKTTDGLLYHTSASISTFPYTDALKQVATEASVIGLGECTHGTAEFTHLRKEIVQMLVTQYGYRHFILESGYAACEPLNEYISTGNGEPEITLLAHSPWPFAVEEFMDVLDWLKTYNSGKPLEEQVKFYGMDMEVRLLAITRSEYKHFGRSVIKRDTVLAASIEQIDTDNREKALNTMLKNNKMNATGKDSFFNANLIRSYIVYLQKNGARRKYREELLYDNARYIIDHLPADEKAVIWAHNNHVSKKYSGRPSLGFMLERHYGSAYKVVGTTFEKGSFLAAKQVGNTYPKQEYTALHYDDVIEEQLKDYNKGVMGWSMAENRQHPLVSKRQKIRSVGASYSVAAEKKKDFYTEQLKLQRSFDYFFIIKESTPSRKVSVPAKQ